MTTHPRYVAAKAYHCDGLRSIPTDKVWGVGEAAMMFATRLARKRYGLRAYCRTARLDHWNEAGTMHAYECFIGKTPSYDRNMTVGHNEWLYIHVR